MIDRGGGGREKNGWGGGNGIECHRERFSCHF